jgi:hypothetical protein
VRKISKKKRINSNINEKMASTIFSLWIESPTLTTLVMSVCVKKNLNGGRLKKMDVSRGPYHFNCENVLVSSIRNDVPVEPKKKKKQFRSLLWNHLQHRLSLLYVLTPF